MLARKVSGRHTGRPLHNMPPESQNIKKNAVIATVAILGSRLFGLIREQIFAFFFGASAVLDAFLVAFRIPNLLRDLFAEGALSQSFVTVFSKKMAIGKKEDAYQLTDLVSTFVIIFIGALVLIGVIFAPQIVSILASGFNDEKRELTITLTRTLMPFILFVSLAAILMGMLNSLGKFFLPHSASTFFNVTSILCGLTLAWYFSPAYFDTVNKPDSQWIWASHAILGMAAGTLIGGFVQYAIQIPSLWRLGYRPKLNFNFKNNDLNTILKLTLPAIIGGAAVQVNVLVNTQFASHLSDGSISYLNYAFRLMQFPLGVFGVAIASASAPALARLIAENRPTDFQRTIRSSLQMSLFLAIPSTVGLIVLAKPIIALIYEHGRFDTLDTMSTAYALINYAFGITAYSLIKIYQPAYLAHHDAKTPMYISLLSIALNFAINWYFIHELHWPHWSLALGTALVATTNLILLVFLFRKKCPGIWNSSLWQNLIKTLAASLIMGLCAWQTFYFFESHLSQNTLWEKMGLALFPIILASTVYFLISTLLGISEAKTLWQKLRRR